MTMAAASLTIPDPEIFLVWIMDVLLLLRLMVARTIYGFALGGKGRGAWLGGGGGGGGGGWGV